MRSQPKPRRLAGRPSLARGEKSIARSLTLPVSAWTALSDEAHKVRISTAELIRRKLGVAR